MQNPNIEFRNPKQFENSNARNPKRYDLEQRTLNFSRQVRAYLKILPRTLTSIEDARQLVRSSGSVGANYIEANESLSKKDFIMRIKICRKEAKETQYWLTLLEFNDVSNVLAEERKKLLKESTELMNIFGAILHKSL